MDTRNNTVIQLEQEIALLLLDKLEHFEISFERASQIAGFILAHLPENLTDEQLKNLLPALDDEFFELAGIVHKHMLEYEEKYKTEQIKNVQEILKHEHFKHVGNRTSEYINQKINK